MHAIAIAIAIAITIVMDALIISTVFFVYSSDNQSLDHERSTRVAVDLRCMKHGCCMCEVVMCANCSMFMREH
jgi:FlaG/FlaF family flagellin (archaellin)